MITVGISDNHANEEKYRLYVDWLLGGNSGVSCIRLSNRGDNAGLLEQCDGFLLSGGGDIHPGLYGGPGNDPTLDDVQPERDAFESELVARVFELDMPMLGICRGMQMVNVLLGGTLIVDLERAGFRSHSSREGVPSLHEVRIGNASAFADCLPRTTGTVASSHHQAVDRLGRTLRIAGSSDDGVVEALEKVNAEGRIGALLVQWHPERMRGPDLTLSTGVRECFFQLIQNRKNNTTGT